MYFRVVQNSRNFFTSIMSVVFKLEEDIALREPPSCVKSKITFSYSFLNVLELFLNIRNMTKITRDEHIKPCLDLK